MRSTRCASQSLPGRPNGQPQRRWIMTEFTHLADVYRDSDPDPDLLSLALRLATTPCSPLYGRNISPDRELGALLLSIAI
jgi:hypothetical protein